MNLSSIIQKGARIYPQKTAIVHNETELTYSELDTRINNITFFLKETGVLPGDRIALLMPNSIEWIILYYAIIRIGAVVLCLSSSYKKNEIKKLVEESKPSIFISCKELFAQIPDLDDLPSIEEIIILEESPYMSALKETELIHSDIPYKECDPDSTCKILFTGGTTGAPKGAMLTHSNVLYSAQNVCFHEKISSEDVSICFMPLNHVFAGIHIMNATFYGGATLILHKKFEFDTVINSIRTHNVTRFYAVPTVYIRILNNLESKQHLSSLTYCFSAATSMAPEIVKRWQKTFNLKIYEAYGMTETSALVSYNHIQKHKIGSVGTAAGLVEVKIIDETGKQLPPGKIGEIVIRGPNVTKGYFNRPEEDNNTFINGWLRSGDLGKLDEEGYLFIVDRLKEMIITGGLNVYPREVEDVLYTHPFIDECAVFGTPHPEYGEAVTACIVAKNNQQISEDDVVRFCKEHLAAYKAPKRVKFTDYLPKSPAGKILKREIRECFKL